MTMIPRPCVCGGLPIVQQSPHTEDFWHVICTSCGAHHQEYGRERAVADWNEDMERHQGMPLWQWRTCVRILNDR